MNDELTNIAMSIMVIGLNFSLFALLIGWPLIQKKRIEANEETASSSDESGAITIARENQAVCSLCNKPIANNQESVACTNCQDVYHHVCAISALPERQCLTCDSEIMLHLEAHEGTK